MLKTLLGLTALAGSLLVAAPPAEAAAGSTQCTGVKVGPAQEVVANQTRKNLGLHGWADTAYGVLPDGPGKYKFLAVAALANVGGVTQSVAVTRGPLSNPAESVQKIAPVEGLPVGSHYGGGGPVYRDPASGMVLQMLHLEQSYPDGFYSTLHLGRFDPATNRTRYLGQLATPTATLEQVKSRKMSADMGTPAFTARDGYLYIHFPDYYIPADGGYAATSLSAARAPLADVLAAAGKGGVVPWKKYLNGSWDSAALGGASTNVRPGERGAWHPNVVRTARGGSLLVQGVSPNEFVLSDSTDGVLNWSAAVPLFREPDRFNAYPTVVGTGPDPSVVGDEFWVYYLQWTTGKQDWNNARMMRRLVTCTGGRDLGTAPLVRSTNGQRHRVTTEVVSESGYYPTHTWLLETGEKPGTKPIFSCRSGAQDYFVSSNPTCEGTSFLNTLGWIYTSPPTAPSVALYRCTKTGLDNHYVSAVQGCGDPAATEEHLIGYALTTSRVAFSRFKNDRERWVTSRAVSGDYKLDKRWFIEGSAKPGTTRLYGCSYNTPNGVNHFISVLENCESHTRLGTEGWIYAQPPSPAAVPLYRCYLPAKYDHFLAGPDCDQVNGAQREGLMGYAVP